MKYRLAMLTHGDSDTLGPTLQSFIENVTPIPDDFVVFHDGGMPSLKNQWSLTLGAGNAAGLPEGTRFVCGGKQLGFCGATRRLWEIAAEPGPEFVFWLEHDFTFDRPVDLRALATILATNPQLAQVSLLRGPENQTERDAGGLYELHREKFVARVEKVELPEGERSAGVVPTLGGIPWLEHSIYFTTTPSLMFRSFLAANPWPSYPDQCEGKFGIDLRAKGYTFGVIGLGEPWVNHIGIRAGGFGY